MTSNEWIAIFGVVAGLGAFISGLCQYTKAQQWKKAEFVAKEIKEFETEPQINIALQMLDWNSREYILLRESPKKTFIEDKDLCRALVPHTTKDSGFAPDEVMIRDVFDQLLDSFEKFEHFIQSGLVAYKDFKPYLNYWIEIIGNRDSGRKPKEFYTCLWNYIDFYGYNGVQTFVKRFGFNISFKASNNQNVKKHNSLKLI